MRYLAIAQEARSQGKTKTEKTGGSFHTPDISTKPLQGKDFVFKRPLGLEVTPPAKPSSGAAPAANAGEAEGKAGRPQRAPSGPATGTRDRALGELPGRGRG